MYYAQAHVITDLWIRPDGPIPARIAAMDEKAVHFFRVWITHTWENVGSPPPIPTPFALPSNANTLHAEGCATG